MDDVEFSIKLDSQGECAGMDEDTGHGEITPQIGMEFATQDDAYNFYNQYAFRTGFGVRWASTNKSRAHKDIDKVICRTFVCDKEGHKVMKNTELDANNEVLRKRPARVGCGAKMKIVLTNSENWKVSKFVEQHDNHELTSPTKVSRHRSHKVLHKKARVRNLITDLHSAGLPNSQISKVVNVLESCAHDNVTPQQVHDHLRVKRKNNIGQNCVKIIRHFIQCRAEDPDFYFSMEVADDLGLRSVFWADGRSRMSYQKFSDVIIFDVTYRTNRFSLPFAPFTGINHHRQSSLFGCALLADETEETFIWLFQKWLECMWGKAPGAIVTDQDAAMRNAIARVFPQTRHRYCDWHLDRNIGEHMLHFKITHDIEFESYFKRLRDSDSVPEAENHWNELMTRYKLGERSWLPKLWERRQSWLSCYLKDTFLAGTRTSQRSESINSFFDGFVNANTSLNEFVVQYDKAVASRRAAEEHEDFMTMNSNSVLTTMWPGEKQAGQCYTRKVFSIFTQELKEVKEASYGPEKLYKEGSTTFYSVGRMWTDKSKWRIVTFDDSNDIVVSCECKHFETNGLLCRHALSILWKKQVKNIPSRYILPRWTIDARHRAPMGVQNVITPIHMNQELCREVRYQCNIALQEAYRSEPFLIELHSYLSNALNNIRHEKQVPNMGESSCAQSQELISQVGSSASNSQNTQLYPEITIRDPTGPVKTKGRPRMPTRIQSGLEDSQVALQKKQRTCSFCQGKGHYKTGCEKAKAAEAAAAVMATPSNT